MDHSEAEQMKAVERYVLGDLTVSEVEEFERHFFDCPQCAEELKALTIFQESARAVFLEPEPAPIPVRSIEPKSPASWWRGLSPLSYAVALGALLVGIFAGDLVFPGREGAAVISAYPLYGQARGEETVVSPAAGSKYYELYLDRTWDREFPRYRAVLRDASGAEKFSLPVKAAAPGEAIHVLIPSHQLASGKYTLVVLGGGDQEAELARFPFTVRLP